MAYTHRIPIPALDVHAVDRYSWLAPMLGLGDGPPDFRFPLSPEAEIRANALVQRHGLGGKPLAVLVPGTLWETKHWRVEGFAEVATHLMQTGRAVVLAGSAAERALSGGGRPLSRGDRFIRSDAVVRLGGLDPPGRGLCDQRLGIDAPDRGAGPAGGQRIRADRPRLDWAVWPAARGRQCGLALRTVLPASAPSLSEWPCLYERGHWQDGYRTSARGIGRRTPGRRMTGWPRLPSAIGLISHIGLIGPL